MAVVTYSLASLHWSQTVSQCLNSCVRYTVRTTGYIQTYYIETYRSDTRSPRSHPQIPVQLTSLRVNIWPSYDIMVSRRPSFPSMSLECRLQDESRRIFRPCREHSLRTWHVSASMQWTGRSDTWLPCDIISYPQRFHGNSILYCGRGSCKFPVRFASLVSLCRKCFSDH